MTNTTPNVPRYRVEKTGRGFWPYCIRAGDGTREVFVGHKKQCAVVAAELETAFEDGKFVSCIAPSPAGVDGLEVVATLLIDDPADQECGDWDIEVESKVAERMAELGGGQHDLCSLSDAQAIIDGLRGELEAAGEILAQQGRRNTELRKMRDQQAKQIGELEGLLREVHDTYRAAIHWEDLRGTMKRIDAAIN